MRSLRASVGPVLLLLAASCTSRESGSADRGLWKALDSVPVAVPAPDIASAFQATSAPVVRRRQGQPTMLHGVRAAPGVEAGARYDRVVFEFGSDSVAGYHVAYTDRPARRCGSGQPVAVTGTTRLIVRLQPAQAHDATGKPAPIARELVPNLPVVKEMKLICDFEGQVEWVLGLDARAGYRVSELAGPARLVIDVAHPR